MRITSRSHYGLQLMTDLAQFRGQGPIPLSQVAKREHLPLKYLEQLALILKSAGLIKAWRGSQGGYTLARQPQKISLREILKVLEGDLAPVSCVIEGGKLTCQFLPQCQTFKTWRKVKEKIEAVLASVTLEAIAKEK